MNYYNEFDPHAAAWLQGLIDENLIPPGHVDTRSIAEISPSDLDGYTQCHFFAGIGGWPLALQFAGVPSTRPLWTGSCPCQPFSVAGEGKGIEDERHLWPVFFALIRACNPPLVFGEQVASAAVLGSSSKPSKRGSGKPVQPVWLDGVFADLESASYACGAADIPAAGVGAPHIRQRLWWGAVRLADSDNGRSQIGRAADAVAHSGCDRQSKSNADIGAASAEFCPTHGMADSDNQLDNRAGNGGPRRRSELTDGREPERLADTLQSRLEGHAGNVHDRNEPGRIGADEIGSVGQGGDTGWQRVSFAADCLGGDEDEFGDECSICGLDYTDDCQCPGPTQDGYEYRERGGVLYARWMGYAGEQRCQEQRLLLRTEEPGRDEAGILEASGGGEVGGMAHAERNGGRADEPQRGPEGRDAHRGIGHWDDAYWHPCRDGKHRRVPTEPRLFPLADGLPYKLARRRTVRPALLRGAGNAIVPEVGAEFVKAFLESIGGI